MDADELNKVPVELLDETQEVLFIVRHQASDWVFAPYVDQVSEADLHLADGADLTNAEGAKIYHEAMSARVDDVHPFEGLDIEKMMIPQTQIKRIRAPHYTQRSIRGGSQVVIFHHSDDTVKPTPQMVGPFIEEPVNITVTSDE